MSAGHRRATPLVVETVGYEVCDWQDGPSSLSADLVYDPADPFAVTLVFHTGAQPVSWTFARELLVEGLYDPAGEGDVQVWPCLSTTGSAVVVVELCSSGGEVVVQVGARAVSTFVTRVLAAVPLGDEGRFVDLDEGLARVLGR